MLHYFKNVILLKTMPCNYNNSVLTFTDLRNCSNIQLFFFSHCCQVVSLIFYISYILYVTKPGRFSSAKDQTDRSAPLTHTRTHTAHTKKHKIDSV